MKASKIKLILIGVLSVCLSCKKEFSVVKPGPLSDVTLVNAIVGSNSVIPDFSNDPIQGSFSLSNLVGNGSFFEYSMPSGNTPVSVWQLPDTIQTIFKGSLNLQPQVAYSLFLAGDNPTKPDTLFTRDQLAYHSSADSVVGIRFVNLSPGSNPISINIQGKANGSEVANLAYKKITGFKVYAATSTMPSPSTGYAFEFRDEASGNLLTSFTYLRNIARFRNITIVFNGLPGNQSIFLVNNY